MRFNMYKKFSVITFLLYFLAVSHPLVSMQFIESFKEKVWNIGDQDKYGNNPIMYSIFENKPLEYILDQIEKDRFNPDEVNDYGQTPYNLALERNVLLQLSDPEIIASLEKYIDKKKYSKKVCINYSKKLPYHSIAKNIDFRVRRSSDILEKITIGTQRQHHIFHAFSPLVDLYIKPLGIKHEKLLGNQASILYVIPGLITDLSKGKTYLGFFEYFIDIEKKLFHRFFRNNLISFEVPESVAYAIKNVEKKSSDDFYPVDPSELQVMIHESSVLDACFNYKGIPAVKIKDQINNLLIYLFRFKSSENVFLDLSIKRKDSLRKALEEIISPENVSDNATKFEKIKELVGKGLDINMTTHNETPLVWAIVSKNYPLVEFLLEHGADINNTSISKSLRTPLMIAVVKGDIENVQILLKYKPDVNFKDSKDDTALSILIGSQSVNDIKITKAILQLLLDHGALINTQNRWGQTPLMIVVVNKHKKDPTFVFEITKFLLEHGANPNLMDKDGKTVFDMTQDPDLLKILHETSKNFPKESEPFVKKVKEPTLAPEEQKALNQKLLNEITAKQSSLKTIEKLLKKGASAKAQEEKGFKNSALHGALQNKSLDLKQKQQIVDLLLKHGADPDVTNNIGISARDMAKKQNVVIK